MSVTASPSPLTSLVFILNHPMPDSAYAESMAFNTANPRPYIRLRRSG